jgi:pantoate--beta-alanine ligase
MEGKFRPGHFDGVGTIVKDCLKILQTPTLVKRFSATLMVKHKQSGSIHRENGLAMSSRNERLNVLEREASIVYQTLLQARKI